MDFWKESGVIHIVRYADFPTIPGRHDGDEIVDASALYPKSDSALASQLSHDTAGTQMAHDFF